MLVASLRVDIVSVADQMSADIARKTHGNMTEGKTKMNLVIVESPAKAKTIEKYLGKDYKVLASFAMCVICPQRTARLTRTTISPCPGALIRSLKNASKISKTRSIRLINSYSQPTRIGKEKRFRGHLLEVLSKKKAFKGKPVERVVFNAITKKTVTDAIANPRQLDMELVEAYLARRALDYLVGFTLSPVLWRKLPGARSAGRVQSVALRLICERETEIEKFDPQEYWTVEGQVKSGSGDFPARLVALNGEKLEKFHTQ